MRIVIDAMGGDNAPLEIVKGTYNASLTYRDTQFVLVGEENKIRKSFDDSGLSVSPNIEIVHTDVYVTMEDDPMVIMKEKNQSSMSVGLKMVKDNEADAFISAGSTGAIHAGSTLLVRKIKGVRRSGIATVLPFKTPVLLLDSGANPTVTSDVMVQWASIGSIYAKKVLKIDNPRVGLLNNGTEEHKGTPLVQETYALLKEDSNINFIGNVEAKTLPESVCDVLITDGFDGNILLKAVEGTSKFLLSKLKDVFTASIFSKVGYLLVKKNLKSLKKSFDPSEYGGAPFLGISKPVIKAHGNSKARDIENAVKQAILYTETNVIGEVETLLSKFTQQTEE